MEIDIVLLACRVMDSRNLKREKLADRQPAKFTAKRERCDKGGSQCTSSKKGWTGSSSDRSKKFTPPDPCHNCAIFKKYHLRKCWKLLGACYQCGEMRHRIRDCPKSSRKAG